MMRRWKLILPAVLVVVALVGFSLAGHLSIVAAQNSPGSTTSTLEQAAGDTEESEAVTEDNDNVENEVEETGVVEEREEEEGSEQQQLATPVNISAAEAEAIALNEVDGSVQETDLDNENGTAVYEVSVKNDNGEYEVKVDAQTGSVLSGQLDRED